MSRLMQMAELMIRGAIATQTMKNLTSEQTKEVDRIVKEVSADPQLIADRMEVSKQLGATIGGDYRSDRDSSLQEFQIAIWRATVYLLYHKEYKYNCTSCGATSYTTQNNTVKDFDRQYPICPKCNRTVVNIDGKEIVSTAIRQDDKYTFSSDNTTILEIGKESINKYITSPIAVLHGDKKIDNPSDILNDPIQRRKWYKTWIWNYFKQILNENSIKTHNKHQVEISGPADEIVTYLIIAELRRERRKFYFDESSKNDKGEYFEIFTSTYQTPYEFTKFMCCLRNEYQDLGIEISANDNSISIKRYNAPLLNASILSEDQVVVLSNDSNPDDNNDDGGDNSWKDIIEYNSADSANIYDGNLEKVESNDLLITIRNSLKGENTKIIFDIYRQSGENWDEFSDKWGDQPACKSHIAKHLGINIKDVDLYREEIKTQCLIHNLS